MLYPLAAQDVDQEAVPTAEVDKGLPGWLSPLSSLFFPQNLRKQKKETKVSL